MDNRLTPEMLADIIATGREVIHRLQAKSLARDPHEPGLARKQKFDANLERLVKQHFARQAEHIRAALEMRYPDRKAVISTPKADDLWEWDDPEFDSDLVIVLTAAAQDGVDLFSQNVTQGMDYNLINRRAADWVRNYSFDLIKNKDGTGIDDTTRKALQTTLENFVETPGMTIGDVMDRLPFDENRVQMIARTEITRTYAQADQLSGEALAEKYPDAEVIKQWHTNADSLVCPDCAPLNNQEVGIDEPFHNDDNGEDYDNPGDTHPGCRCWRSTTLRLSNASL